VSQSNLTGSLPASFASLSALTGLSLSDSGLCGSVPSLHQPNDGRLPKCPSRTTAAEVAVDVITIACSIGGVVLGVLVTAKAWQMRHHIQRRLGFSDGSKTLDEAAAPESYFEASSADPEDVTALQQALLPTATLLPA
jgi:hypothetical protein